jgi:hypothetical protein
MGWVEGGTENSRETIMGQRKKRPRWNTERRRERLENKFPLQDSHTDQQSLSKSKTLRFLSSQPPRTLPERRIKTLVLGLRVNFSAVLEAFN